MAVNHHRLKRIRLIAAWSSFSWWRSEKEEKKNLPTVCSAQLSLLPTAGWKMSLKATCESLLQLFGAVVCLLVALRIHKRRPITNIQISSPVGDDNAVNIQLKSTRFWRRWPSVSAEVYEVYVQWLLKFFWRVHKNRYNIIGSQSIQTFNAATLRTQRSFSFLAVKNPE